MKYLRVDHHGDVIVVTPHGYLVGGDETEEFRAMLGELDAAGRDKVVINLMETMHLNSTALGAFNEARAKFARRKARIRLCHLNDRIQNALVVTRLGLEFDVFDTERQAVDSFAEPGGA
jgi:anti-anti-sigma factor